MTNQDTTGDTTIPSWAEHNLHQRIKAKEKAPTKDTTSIDEMRELISFAIMDGQNQIHDLRDGTVTPEEVTERMFKSLDYFTAKANKLISDQVAKAYKNGVKDGWKESGEGYNYEYAGLSSNDPDKVGDDIADRLARLRSKE